ncbi:MAG: hypothetical protein CVU91_06580 [Firmicutes bacterium HGW-Firmicutes-16]|nr:MAG: hypothetical protein CVU91_06580 [Firmicutes bacterium HGW-Firmicutes-16]
MNILCCFKIVSDLDLVMERDWSSADVSGVDLSYVKKVISCFDEAGIETALRIKDSAEKQGETVHITAITLGNGKYEAFFKNLFAVGVERILQGTLSTERLFSPYMLSGILSELAGNCEYDLVITGMQSADGANGLTPYFLAERQGIPCINNVSELQYTDGKLKVTCDMGNGVRKATVHTPALYAIGNSVNPYLRMATLKQKLAVSKLSAETIEISETSYSGGRNAELCSLSHEKKMRHCVFVEGKTCGDKAAKLLEAYPEVVKR